MKKRSAAAFQLSKTMASEDRVEIDGAIKNSSIRKKGLNYNVKDEQAFTPEAFLRAGYVFALPSSGRFHRSKESKDVT